MKFLIIAQDLRHTGTSEGIVSRSFIANLRDIYPQAIIDVFYIKSHDSHDCNELLGADSIVEYTIPRKIPLVTKWLNKVYWRLFNESLRERYIQNLYKKKIATIDYKAYNHVFIRSSGLEYETLLACNNLPILKQAIINFHDPYPNFWDTGSNIKLSNLELFRLKRIKAVVEQAKVCISPSTYLSRDLTVLYGSNKVFKTLPHQFNKTAFNFEQVKHVREKQKPCCIMYHGTLQLGRDMDTVLDAYVDCINKDFNIKNNSEFVLRLKSNQYSRLKAKYEAVSNIIILEANDFSSSYIEQSQHSNILIILENNSGYSNILPGKIPVAAATGCQILNICPKESETRHITINETCIATSTNKSEIATQLEALIKLQLDHAPAILAYGDYFSVDQFKSSIQDILN
ncbi:hypothetical protein JAO71_07760 [Olleya sp. YSTF-M6]|uniref:Glycosyltransferase n=1 Tax=Olleya sediminilitoris TaxID=2795739 RepID=A0ABS1WKQ1_9FLAO|nr:hypothetical protein [Olleya sediminilitoris]MBL7559697.1 hypothetical protein [Olleya sediminilitoris]